MEKHINLIIDVSGTKKDAIHGIFQNEVYRKKVTQINLHVIESFKGATPLSLKSLYDSLESRITRICNSTSDCYAATAQRCYFTLGEDWYLVAGVAIKAPFGKMVPGLTSAVSLPEKASVEKLKNPAKNFNVIFKELFPTSWDGKKSMYEFLTGEPEKEWLQEPLRHCGKKVL